MRISMVMANHPDLLEYLEAMQLVEGERGLVDLKHVRNFVSSPRLCDFYIRAFSHPDIYAAGDTFLDQRTMLADNDQKTYAISQLDWCELVSRVEMVPEFDWRDASVMKVQIWPFSPKELSEFQMCVAVALSYNLAELRAESRISSAIDDLVNQYGFYTDDF